MITMIVRSLETCAWFAVVCAGLVSFAVALNAGADVCALASGIIAGGAVCMIIVRA